MDVCIPGLESALALPALNTSCLGGLEFRIGIPTQYQAVFIARELTCPQYRAGPLRIRWHCSSPSSPASSSRSLPLRRPSRGPSPASRPAPLRRAVLPLLRPSSAAPSPSFSLGSRAAPPLPPLRGAARPSPSSSPEIHLVRGSPGGPTENWRPTRPPPRRGSSSGMGKKSDGPRARLLDGAEQETRVARSRKGRNSSGVEKNGRGEATAR